MEGHGRSWKVIEGHGKSFPIMVGVVFRIICIVSPSPSLFPLDFGFWILDLDFGPGLRAWTWAWQSRKKRVLISDLLVSVEDWGRSITTCWCGSIGAGWPGTIIAFWPPAAWATSGATSRASSGAASRTASSLSRDDGDGCKEDDNQEDLHLLAINVKLEMWVWGPYTGFKCQLMMIHRFLEFKGTNVWQKLERTFERMTMKSTKGWKQVWWQSKYTHLEYRLL